MPANQKIVIVSGAPGCERAAAVVKQLEKNFEGKESRVNIFSFLSLLNESKISGEKFMDVLRKRAKGKQVDLFLNFRIINHLNLQVTYTGERNVAVVFKEAAIATIKGEYEFSLPGSSIGPMQQVGADQFPEITALLGSSYPIINVELGKHVCGGVTTDRTPKYMADIIASGINGVLC